MMFTDSKPTEVVEIGSRYTAADRHKTFDARYNGKQYLFIQNYWEDHWAVSQEVVIPEDRPSNVLEHLLNVSRAAALLDRAGFTPQRMDDANVLWIRDDDVPLWPDR